jgi:hypothetical protein
MKVTSVLSGSTAPVWVLPDQAWWRDIWIPSPIYLGGVFTLSTSLTRYRISRSGRRCVRLQCWTDKRAFPRVRALDNVVVGQIFF